MSCINLDSFLAAVTMYICIRLFLLFLIVVFLNGISPSAAASAAVGIKRQEGWVSVNSQESSLMMPSGEVN